MNASEQPGSATGAPTFSIIMPAYNCRPWIRQSVLSVLGQSEPDFELIIVDDASSDGTLDAVADLAQGDARIRLIRTSANAGAASARNAGLQASRGRLLAFLDADDLYEPTRLAAHLAVFDAFPDAAMVFSDFRGFGDGGEEASYLVAQRNLAQSAAPHMEGPLRVRGSDADVYRCRASLATFASVHYNVVYMHCVTLARAAVQAQRVWFPAQLAVCEDLDFFCRILEAGPAYFLAASLAWYRRRAGSLTQTSESFLRGMADYHTANLERRREGLTPRDARIYEARIASMRRSLAWQLRARDAAAESRREYWRAFRMRPDWSGARLLAKSLVPKRLAKALRS